MSPFVFILFGATGDLAVNKLYPALFSLFKQGLLGEKFYIIGFSRRQMSDPEFANFVQDSLMAKGIADVDGFLKNVYYQQGIFDEKKGYEELIEKLTTFDSEVGACITRVFYLATPPDNYSMILNNLEQSKLSEGCGQGSEKWTRLAIEKPFGKDIDTARELDQKLSEIFGERQIFRVDHYLGKETVQNMLAFRFANGIFDPVWNKDFIDHVQITFAEKKGIGTRGKFFDGVGILRDVAQNHLLQLVTAVTMEQPRSFTKEDVRDERAKAIEAIKEISPEEVHSTVIRAQYSGYTKEKDVSSESQTETFVAMKFFVETPRFSGVPFYVRTGKKLPQDVVEISVVFKQTCHLLFKEYGCPEIGNVLTIRIQPDEGIRLRVIAKKPGTKLGLATVDMKFSYEDEFNSHGVDAYEKVLLDILFGDQMLFNRSDELESSWTFISNILNGWKKDGVAMYSYEEGEWGPKEADELIKRDGRKWL